MNNTDFWEKQGYTFESGKIDFACSCGEENKNHQEEAYQKCLNLLSQGTKEMSANWVTEKNFVTGVIWSLNWDYNVWIEGIPNDQWFAVRAEHHDYDQKIITRYYVQCDSVEEGLAQIYLHFVENNTDQSIKYEPCQICVHFHQSGPFEKCNADGKCECKGRSS